MEDADIVSMSKNRMKDRRTLTVKSMSNDQPTCKFCGKDFEFASDKNNHESTCGISRLSDYGIDTETFENLREAEIEGEVTLTRQLQLNETPIGRCWKCGERITEQDKYMNLEDYFECPNCEKALSRSAL